MRFTFTALLLAASLSSNVLCKPVPSEVFDEIERRWHEGESEVPPTSHTQMLHCDGTLTRLQKAQIHAGLTYREATPAWPIVREEEQDNDNAFVTTTDERSMEQRHRHRRSRHRHRHDAAQPRSVGGLINRVREAVDSIMATEGGPGLIANTKRSEEDAPVLRPRKGMRYEFRA